MTRSKAKTAILNWFDKGKPNSSDRRSFSQDIDTFFRKLSDREDWKECISTHIKSESRKPFVMRGKAWRSDPTDNGLIVTSVVPGWSFGWRGVFKLEHSEEIFSWLGHYARQYIHRSNICKVLMASWEREEIILHPFGDGFHVKRYSDINPISNPLSLIASATQPLDESWGNLISEPEVYRSKWAHRNTLDPAIHQAVFYFLRGQELMRADFAIESLVAIDCVSQSIQRMDWSWAPGNPKRERRDLCKALGFGLASQSTSEEVYFLRNQFGAHAGGWRWWDAEEYLDDGLLDRASRLSSRLLRKAADIEKGHRKIEPNPESWAVWMEKRFDVLWDAIWFRSHI